MLSYGPRILLWPKGLYTTKCQDLIHDLGKQDTYPKPIQAIPAAIQFVDSTPIVVIEGTKNAETTPIIKLRTPLNELLASKGQACHDQRKARTYEQTSTEHFDHA